MGQAHLLLSSTLVGELELVVRNLGSFFALIYPADLDDSPIGPGGGTAPDPSVLHCSRFRLTTSLGSTPYSSSLSPPSSARCPSTYFSHISHQPNPGGSPTANGASTYRS